MSNGNFIVQNGLQVGPLTIDAATGSITTSGNVSITGDLGVSQISKNDSSIGINDTGSGSNVSVIVDGTQEMAITSGGVTVTNGDLTLNAQGDLRFADSDSSNWVAFQAPATVASNVTWTLPATDGAANQALVTNGSGSLSWAAAGASLTDDTTTNATRYILFDDATSGYATSILVSSSKLTYNPSTGVVGATGVTTTGDIVVGGNLRVNGTTTTIETNDLVVEDKNVIIGNVATPTDTTADGGGITLKGATDKTFNWVNASSAWTSSENLNLATGKSYEINGTSVLNATTLGSGVVNSSLTSVGTLTNLTVTNTITGNVSGNAGTATKLATARTIALTGDVTGSGTFDGSGNLSIAATIAADSVALGTDTTGNYVASITNGSYLTGANGGSEGAALTLAVDATSTNTASKVVARDASGNFSAGTITASLAGNATSADKWSTARTISLTGDVTGSATIDGSGNISIATTSSADSIALGTDTTGNYVATITGTANQVTVTGSGTETAAVTLALPQNIHTGATPTFAGATLTGTLTGTAVNAATIGNTGSTLTGTLQTAAQPNITSVGTLTGLTLSGTLTGTTINAATIGNTGSTLTGTLQTAAQPNITSVGTLTGLTLSGTLTGTTINAATIGNASAAHTGATMTLTSTLNVAGTATVNALTSNGAISGTTGTFTGAVSGSSTANFSGAVTVASLSANADIVVGGNLTVNGTTTTINSTTLSVDDKNIELGSVATPTDTTADGGGITLKGATDKTFQWLSAASAWTSSEDINVVTGKGYEVNGVSVLNATTLGSGVVNSSLTSVGTLTNLTVTNTITGSVSGNAGTATKLATARTIALTGDVTGSGTFDGSGNLSIAATIAADSVALGTDTTGNYVASITNGSYITGGNGGSEGAGLTLAVDATSANTASKVVARDASGNFSAGTITATLSGNSTTATTLQTARNINGVSFNGSADITITAANPNTLTLGTGLTGTSYNGSAAVTAAVSYGTTAGTACQGNDSRLSDARVASDVYAWAKAATKPSYSASEVGLGNVTNESKATMFTNPTLTGTVTLPSITKSGTSGTGDIGSSSNYFGTVYGKATTAQYADLAENYAADAEYEPGTVVCFGGEAEVTICDVDHCRKVAGVVSTNPAYLMNGMLEGTKAAVALQGRVPCKVVGPVRKGDMMVSAGNGRARAEAEPKTGAVIGKALENFEGTEGVIEVVIGRV